MVFLSPISFNVCIHIPLVLPIIIHHLIVCNTLDIRVRLSNSSLTNCCGWGALPSNQDPQALWGGPYPSPWDTATGPKHSPVCLTGSGLGTMRVLPAGHCFLWGGVTHQAYRPLPWGPATGVSSAPNSLITLVSLACCGTCVPSEREAERKGFAGRLGEREGGRVRRQRPTGGRGCVGPA